MIILEIIENFFEEKYVLDSRSPAFSINLVDELQLNLFVPEWMFFFQVALLVLFQMVTGCVLGAVMYFGIVTRREKYSIQNTSYMIGYGVVIPLSLWIPFVICDWLDIRSVALRMSLVSLPMTVSLRCLATMHGFVSTTYKNSLRDYIVSVAFILRPKLDKNGQTIPWTINILGKSVLKYLFWGLVQSIFFTFLIPCDFYPFESTIKASEGRLAFEFGTLYNTFFQLILGNMSLAFSLSGISILAALLTGIVFDDNVTNFPMFLSTSVSDFWGSRWNNLIHSDLKHGVYKPVRYKTGNKTLAAFSTFFVSGIIHEYVWFLLFYTSKTQRLILLADEEEDSLCCSTCYCDGWVGKQSILFCYAGASIALEYTVGETLSNFTPTWLPAILKSHLLVLTTLPVAHFFTMDLASAGYFHSLQNVLPLLLLNKKK